MSVKVKILILLFTLSVLYLSSTISDVFAQAPSCIGSSYTGNGECRGADWCYEVEYDSPSGCINFGTKFFLCPDSSKNDSRCTGGGGSATCTGTYSASGPCGYTGTPCFDGGNCLNHSISCTSTQKPYKRETSDNSCDDVVCTTDASCSALPPAATNTPVPGQAPSCSGAGSPEASQKVTCSQYTSNASTTTYTCDAWGVTNASAVRFPTWSGVGGQDDIVWYNGTDLGSNHWRATITASSHLGDGSVFTDVWMNGTSEVYCGGRVVVRNTSPTLTPSPTPQLLPPSPTVTTAPISHTPTPTVDPLSSDPYRIPIGTKATLIIHISPAIETEGALKLKFPIKLFAAEKTPEILVRLKAVDKVTAITPGPEPADSCHAEGPGEYFYTEIPMVADTNKVYWPKVGGKYKFRGTEYTITADGWVILIGTQLDRPYDFFVKGPKHRDMLMARNVAIHDGSQETLNWSQTELEPGDLPDPNKANKQDCTANAVDFSLTISRIGSTDAPSLSVADVNYDGVINGNDVAEIVHTLSTKPDDDR